MNLLSKRIYRKRVIYLISVIIVMALGLASRRFSDLLLNFIAKYVGDTLWALMIFLGIAFFFSKLPIKLFMIFITRTYCYTIPKMKGDKTL